MKKRRNKEKTLDQLITEAGLSVSEKKDIQLALNKLTEQVNTDAKRINFLGLLSIINKTAYKSDKYGFKKSR